MAQEIERARALLSALVRDGVMPGDRAEAAYEAWVALAGDLPFGLFLIRDGRADPSKVRLLLRIAAVPGLPYPERFTFERFEDLLMGQLGIEAQILSPKLLQTVRAVQDKKVEENKLRRLDELLPRAGFDAVQLRLLRDHLAERVLLCPGCLARYPRREHAVHEVVCPRCGERIAARAVAASDLRLLPDSAKHHLLVSSGENSAVFETLTVAARERRAAEPSTRGGPPPTLVALALGSLLVVGLGAGWALSGKTPPKRTFMPRPPVTPTDGDPAGGPPTGTQQGPVSPARVPTLAEAQNLDRRLRAEGKWEELLALWRRVEPGVGEVAVTAKTAKATRIEELERRVPHAASAARALETARATPADGALERDLARSLDGAPLELPPYSAITAELRARREARRTAARADGLRRLAVARDTPAESPDAWPARLAQARRAPLAAVEVGGRVADRVTIERLDERGFAVRREGDDRVRAFTWTEEPALGLLVMQRAARPGEVQDQLEVLRRALLARDFGAAETALRSLEAPEGILDPAAVVAGAATFAPPSVLEGGGWRVRWPTRVVSPDLDVIAGQPVSESLALTGTPCELATPALDVADAAVELSLRLDGSPREPFVAADLIGARVRRSYLVRWGPTSWQLEVDLGAGANVLQRGTLPAQAQAARLRVTQTALVVLLDGVERASAPVSARFDSVSLRAGAAAGPLAVSELAIQGALSPAWIERTTAELDERITERVATLADHIASRAAPELPRLSVEDPQGFAGATPEALARYEEARRAVVAGQVDRAASALDETLAAAPGLLPAIYMRALVATLSGDQHLAQQHLRAALARDEAFDEARALLALTLARGGRKDAAVELLKETIAARPDLPHAHLAQAWVAWWGRPLDAPVDAAPVREALRVARALGPGDPLVRANERVLLRALAVDAATSVRHVDGGHAVLATQATGAQAKDLHRTMATLVLRFERELRRGAAGPPLVAALLPARGGPVAFDGAARWDADLGMILVREGTSLGWDLALATARAYVARTFGAPPPWLEAGLTAALAAPAAAEDPPGYKEVLADAPPWGAAEWRALLAMPRGPLVANTLARAKAWALVTLSQRQAPSWQVINRLLDLAARGEAVDWPENAPIDLGALDAQIATGLRRPR